MYWRACLLQLRVSKQKAPEAPTRTHPFSDPSAAKPVQEPSRRRTARSSSRPESVAGRSGALSQGRHGPCERRGRTHPPAQSGGADTHTQSARDRSDVQDASGPRKGQQPTLQGGPRRVSRRSKVVACSQERPKHRNRRPPRRVRPVHSIGARGREGVTNGRTPRWGPCAGDSGVQVPEETRGVRRTRGARRAPRRRAETEPAPIQRQAARQRPLAAERRPSLPLTRPRPGRRARCVRRHDVSA